jgi:ribose-phosphate pyrophosphokinase
MHGEDMKVFLTHSTQHLRRSFKTYGCDIGRYETYTFADRERGYCLREKVNRKSVATIASVLPNPESLFELMALHRLIVENGARETILVIPYLGYARQDRPNQPGEGSLGVMVLELIQKLNPSRLILLDVHSDRIRKAFGPSVIELSALPLFAEALWKQPPDVIVSPDAGFKARAEELAGILKPHPEVAVIDKVRPHPNVAIAKRLHGDVRGKGVLIVDDIIDTGGTLSQAVKLVSEKGAHTIRLAATHGIFSGGARNRLFRLPIREILITNTLPQIRYPKIHVFNIAPLLLDFLR